MAHNEVLQKPVSPTSLFNIGLGLCTFLCSALLYRVFQAPISPVFLCPSSRIYRVLSAPLFVSNHNTGSGRISVQQAVYLPLISSPSLPLAALHNA